MADSDRYLSRRRWEFKDVQRRASNCFVNVTADDRTLRLWRGTILPNKPPFNAAGFNIVLDLSDPFPFTPPKVKLITSIYHPNVTEDGDVNLPISYPRNWLPGLSRVVEVIQQLVTVIDNPDVGSGLRQDVALEFANDYNTFYRKAADHAKEYGKKRPTME